MSSVGWIKLHRKILNWEWYQDANTCRVYIHLLLTAVYEDGRWKGKELKKGDCLFTGPEICKELGITKQELRTVLKKLTSTQYITLTATSKYYIANIVKYMSFIDVDKNKKNDATPNQPQQQHQVQHANNPQQGALKEINNLNNNIYNKNNNSNELLQKERGTRFDVNQQLLQSWREYAVEQGVEGIDNEFERFKNYWTSPNAKKPLKKDWTATWRNWILKNANKNNSGWQKEEKSSKQKQTNAYEGMSFSEVLKAKGIK